MRSVNLRRTLFQNDLTLIGTIYAARTEHRLPTLPHAAFRYNQIIEAIAFHELRTFSNRSFVDRHALIKQCLTIRRHSMNDNRPSPMTASPQISLSVFIPERTGIFPFLYTFNEMEWCPWAVRILGSRHIEPFIGGAEIDIEESVVITDSWSPGATSIMGIRIPSWFIEATIYLTDILPIHHIIALQHLHTKKMEVGCHHIIFRPNTDNIRIGEICIKYGIAIGSITLITPTFRVYFHKIRASIRLFGSNLDIREPHIAGMTHEESLRWQVSPHGCFWIVFLFLIFDGFKNFIHFIGRNATLMMDGDIRNRDISYRIIW